MAHKAPGKHYRAGLTLIELTRMFPDDAAAERWFVKNALAGRRALPVLWLTERAGTRDAEAAALSLPGLPQGFLGQARHAHGRVKTRISDMGDGDLPDDDGTQGHVQHEASP